MALGLVLAAATVLAYEPVRHNDFVYDDVFYVAKNLNVTTGLNGPNFAWALTTNYTGNWHPLTWLSLQLDATLFGSQPWGYHLTNLALHVANTILLFLVLHQMTSALWRSALVAGLFALHPLHVESVAWVAERKDVLSTLFGLLALLAYVAYARRPGLGRYLLVAAAFALSLMAKAMLVTLPLVLLLLDYWPLRRLPLADGRAQGNAGPAPARPFPARTLRSAVLEKVPLLLLSVGACAAMLYAQQANMEFAREIPLGARLGNAVVAYAVYLRKLLWPADLGVFYPHPGTALSGVAVAGAALVLAAGTAAALRFGRRFPYLPVGWFWYLGTLVPVIGLVQVGRQALADRYTYVPLIGIFLLASWGLADLLARRPAQTRVLGAAAAGAMLLAGAVLSRVQVSYWHDAKALWTHTLEVAPHNAVAHANLGTALLFFSPFPEDAERAREHFQRALEIEPDQLDAQLGLAVYDRKHGRVEEAMQRFRAVLRQPPDRANARMQASAHAALGTHLAERGQLGEAGGHLREAVKLDPNTSEYHSFLGEVLRAQGRREDAIACFRQAVALEPQSVSYRCNLALNLYEAGRKGEAGEHYREVVRLEPDWLANTGREARRLATDPDAGNRDGARAVKLATQACQATGEEVPLLLDTLAAAYAEVGRFDTAVAVAREAATLARELRQDDLARAVQQRLRLYEQHRPLREQ